MHDYNATTEEHQQYTTEGTQQAAYAKIERESSQTDQEELSGGIEPSEDDGKSYTA